MNIRQKTILIYALGLLAALLLAGCEFPYPPVLDTPAPETPAPVASVFISEVMASNKATLADAHGSFPDWLELYNGESGAVALGGWTLSDGKKTWTFPDISIEPGAYLLLMCGGSDPLNVSFSLSSSGESLSLAEPGGGLADSFAFGESSSDVSYIRGEDGVPVLGEYATPGYENSDSGYALFQSSRSSGALVISEAMTYNEWYLPQVVNYYDWVEIKNVSSQSVNLSDYYISDDDDDLVMYALPDLALAPGGYYVLQCVDVLDEGYTADYAPFALNSSSETLYISDKSGALSDYAVLSGLKYGGSYGRMDGENGFFYFDVPSPGGPNAVGQRLISHTPVSGGVQGVFDSAQPVEVVLSAQGDIYYTLDGSTPTSSSLRYSGPFEMSTTGVVRAVSLEPGKLISSSLDLSYIINEGHELPVVSLISDPAGFYDQDTGIYTNPTTDWERAASLALFDGDEGFSIDCSVKIHGATSREAQAKKSFKIKFKDRFEGPLEYDLFENGVTEYSSILLRAAQESSQSSNLRDILMHQLAEQCYTGLPTQDYKFAVLYLNGEYWGLYALREAHSVEHYANHFGYSTDSVEMLQGSWGKSSLNTANAYVHYQDLDEPGSYEYLKTLIDVDNVITWHIIESYSGNLDINPPNVRFYTSTEDGISRYALVDLDLGLFTTGFFETALQCGYPYGYFPALCMYCDEYRTRTLELLSQYLKGPLSDENVVNTLYSLADEIRSEIPRDAQRWDYDEGSWERDLGYIEGRLLVDQGMACRFAVSAQLYLSMGGAEWDQYFSEFDR